MQTTSLGSTGLTVSKICFGSMTYGDPQWRPWVLNESEAEPFFKKAVEAGINFFDTANIYSLGRSEEITGKWLKKYAYREEQREMLPLCVNQGIGVIPWSPLARGMLAGTRKKLGDDSTTRSKTDGIDQMLYSQESDWDVVDAVKNVAEQCGDKPAQVALAWLHAKIVLPHLLSAYRSCINLKTQ